MAASGDLRHRAPTIAAFTQRLNHIWCCPRHLKTMEGVGSTVAITDRPYDQFIREQLAGDALGDNRATGFLVTSAVLLPGQIGKDEESKRLARQDELTEIVTNVGEAFLGLSIGCARCHDHKFDAISAKDFYSMQAFFSGVQFGERVDSNPAQEARRKSLRSRVEALSLQLAEFAPLAGSGVERPMVNARENMDRFEPLKAKKVRLVMESTIWDNKLEPFIDELEIYSLDGTNLALSVRGAKAKSSDGQNTAELANDGIHGNDSCWRGKQKGKGWLEIELTEEATIDRVSWGRDRTGRYADRLGRDYRIEVTDASGRKTVVADSTSRLVYEHNAAGASISEEGLEPHQAERLKELWAAREPIQAKLIELSSITKIYTGKFTSPENIHFLRRGDPEQPLEEVRPAVLSALGSLSLPAESEEQRRRKAVADWVASPENPLTTRVMVNRIWQWHFGMGLVETANDFGQAGTAPSHPQLLDWLASELVESGWSIKHLHRKIVLSATYGQSSLVRPDAVAVDGDARLLWRFPSRRLEAEAIRDSILTVSGRLNPEMGGPGFNLFNQRGGLSGYTPITSFQEEGRKRMIYAHRIRMERSAVFGAFDCPDAGQSLPRRRQSTTPIQALNLFNSQFIMDEARALEARLVAEDITAPEARVRRAWQLAYGREPSDREVAEAVSLTSEHGWPTLFRALYNSSEFLYLP